MLRTVLTAHFTKLMTLPGEEEVDSKVPGVSPGGKPLTRRFELASGEMAKHLLSRKYKQNKHCCFLPL